MGLAKVAGIGAAKILKLVGSPNSNNVLEPASAMLAAVRGEAIKVAEPSVAVLTPASCAATVVSGVTPIASPDL